MSAREAGRPAIVVLAVPGSAAVRDIVAGIEEEGVPYLVEMAEPHAAAVDLAQRAAMLSPLGVGIGVGVFEAWVQHVKFSGPVPELSSAATDSRTLGHNAARIVVGLPLKSGQER